MSAPKRISGEFTSAAFLCAALVLFAVAVFVTAASVDAQAASILQGRVTNGTPGEPADRVANIEVILFQMGSAGPVTHTVQTDSDGRFAFPDVKVDANSQIFAKVDYDGIHYFSDILSPEVATSTPLTLTVYESQPLAPDFQIDRAHFIVDVGQKSLSTVEIVQVTNTTGHAFLMPLPLAEDASTVEFQDPLDDFRAVHGADGSLSYPILPTTQQVLLGEQFSIRPPEYTLKIRTLLKIGRLNVLVSQAGGVQAASTQLKPGPPFQPQSGATYSQLSGDNIPTNTTVAVSLTNLPGAGGPSWIRPAVLVIGALAGLTLLVVPVVRRRSAEAERRADRSPVATTDERLQRLRAIAALDDAFEAGKMQDDEYVTLRASLKAELMKDAGSTGLDDSDA